MVVSGGGDNRARIWEVATGDEIFELSGARHFVEDVEFNYEGNLVIGASDDNMLRLWDANTGEMLRSFLGQLSARTDA